ncbi:glycosyltransferase family 2 protein [Thermodesulfobacteriota bacterium]
MIIFKIILYLLGLYLLFYSAYIFVLSIANLLIKEKSRRSNISESIFALIIPAHNEEIFLPRLLKSTGTLSYPKDLYSIFVIADNCDDRTVDIAKEFSTNVFERNDTEKIGKGYAIKYALENISQDNFNAVLIIDADSVVDKNILVCLSKKIEQGAKAIQCYNAVANPYESWFTVLMNVARDIGNEIIEPAKEKLGLSSHLMGNGMCFTKEILNKYGWDAFSIGEDWEYYTTLVLNGERVAFAKYAKVFHQESRSLKQATSQRIRWSSGRFSVLRSYGIKILFKGIKSLNLKLIDASFPLVLPNPSFGINLSVLGLVLSLAVFWYERGFAVWFSVMIMIQLIIFLTAAMYTERKVKSILSVFLAPIFLIWKMAIDVLSIFGSKKREWVRTSRQ